MATDIEDCATRWILKLDRETPTDAEREEFERWLAASSHHRATYRRLNEAWKSTDGMKVWRPRDGSIDAKVLFRPIEASRGRSRGWAMAGVVAFGCVVLAASMLSRRDAATTVYSTDVGGYQRVLLEDGSVLQLNTNSEATVLLKTDRRVVHLLRGEAYFDVAHDAQRPFDVIAGHSTVRAVGTAFLVRLKDSAHIDVAVTQGRVAISSDDTSVGQSQVAAGEIAHSSGDAVTVAKTESTELKRRLAWAEGELVFKKERLANVVAEFNRYNHRQLAIDDPFVADLEVGGNFKSTELDSFVSAVTQSLGLKAAEKDGVIHLSQD